MPIGHFFYKNNKFVAEWSGQLIFLGLTAPVPGALAGAVLGKVSRRD
jgi:hypothetical protein